MANDKGAIKGQPPKMPLDESLNFPPFQQIVAEAKLIEREALPTVRRQLDYAPDAAQLPGAAEEEFMEISFADAQSAAKKIDAAISQPSGRIQIPMPSFGAKQNKPQPLQQPGASATSTATRKYGVPSMPSLSSALRQPAPSEDESTLAEFAHQQEAGQKGAQPHAPAKPSSFGFSLPKLPFGQKSTQQAAAPSQSPSLPPQPSMPSASQQAAPSNFSSLPPSASSAPLPPRVPSASPYSPPNQPSTPSASSPPPIPPSASIRSSIQFPSSSTRPAAPAIPSVKVAVPPLPSRPSSTATLSPRAPLAPAIPPRAKQEDEDDAHEQEAKPPVRPSQYSPQPRAASPQSRAPMAPAAPAKKPVQKSALPIENLPEDVPLIRPMSALPDDSGDEKKSRDAFEADENSEETEAREEQPAEEPEAEPAEEQPAEEPEAEPAEEPEEQPAEESESEQGESEPASEEQEADTPALRLIKKFRSMPSLSKKGAKTKRPGETEIGSEEDAAPETATDAWHEEESEQEAEPEESQEQPAEAESEEEPEGEQPISSSRKKAAPPRSAKKSKSSSKAAAQEDEEAAEASEEFEAQEEQPAPKAKLSTRKSSTSKSNAALSKQGAAKAKPPAISPAKQTAAAKAKPTAPAPKQTAAATTRTKPTPTPAAKPKSQIRPTEIMYPQEEEQPEEIAQPRSTAPRIRTHPIQGATTYSGGTAPSSGKRVFPSRESLAAREEEEQSAQENADDEPSPPPRQVVKKGGRVFPGKKSVSPNSETEIAPTLAAQAKQKSIFPSALAAKKKPVVPEEESDENAQDAEDAQMPSQDEGAEGQINEPQEENTEDAQEESGNAREEQTDDAPEENTENMQGENRGNAQEESNEESQKAAQAGAKPSPPKLPRVASLTAKASAAAPVLGAQPDDGAKSQGANAIADEIYFAYAREKIKWLYDIYKMGGMTVEELRSQVQEKMDADAGKGDEGAAPPPPQNPAFQNLNKELGKKFKK